VNFWRWDRRSVAEISCAMSSYFSPKLVCTMSAIVDSPYTRQMARAAAVTFQPSINHIKYRS
jgi:hypothetical protein